jgi:hypothetical protein
MSESRETLKVDSVKDEIKQTLTRQWPRISILEINSAHPEIEGAACVASDGPEEVLAALNGLLLPSGRRYSEYFRHQARDLSKRARSNVRRSEELAA